MAVRLLQPLVVALLVIVILIKNFIILCITGKSACEEPTRCIPYEVADISGSSVHT